MIHPLRSGLLFFISVVMVLMASPTTADSSASASSSLSSLATTSSLGLATHHHMHHHEHELVHSKQLRNLLNNNPPIMSTNNNNNNNDHHQKNNEGDQQSHHNHIRRRVQDDDDDGGAYCPGTPFLWKIINDNNNQHVGFAIGTMHLPAAVVATPETMTAIGHALEDSCDVYGELNVVDANVTSELQTCMESIEATAATANDIPSESLRNATLTKLLEISIKQQESNPDGVDMEAAMKIAMRKMDLPLYEVQQLILYGNTIEYTNVVRGDLLYSDDYSNLDMDMLKLGRPADDLEEVSTQCDILKALNPTKEEFIQNFTDDVAAAIEASLDASLSREIELYKCGNIDTFKEQATAASIALDEATDNALLTDRNNKMAKRIDTILQSNPDERITFAVGVSHWIIGDNNLQKLLKEGYGYSMEHIPDWNKDMVDDHSNSHCEVVLHPELGLFVDNPPVPGAAPVDLTPGPTHNVIKDTYYTNPPSPETVGGDGAVQSPTDGTVLVSDSPTRKPGTPPASSSSSFMIGSKASGMVLATATASFLISLLLWCA